MSFIQKKINKLYLLLLESLALFMVFNLMIKCIQTHYISFAVTFKDKNIDEEKFKEKLGDKLQGKIIREKMWIYNDKDKLKLGLDDIINTLKQSGTIKLIIN